MHSYTIITTLEKLQEKIEEKKKHAEKLNSFIETIENFKKEGRVIPTKLYLNLINYNEEIALKRYNQNPNQENKEELQYVAFLKYLYKGMCTVGD